MKAKTEIYPDKNYRRADQIDKVTKKKEKRKELKNI